MGFILISTFPSIASQNDENNRRALEQIAEVKRILGAIDHAMGQQRPASLLVTSAAQDEGKSLFASSLATTAALMRQDRVIALDLNWHRPAMHRYFGCEMVNTVDKIQETELSDLVVRPNGCPVDLLLAPVDHDQHKRHNSDIFSIGWRLVDQAKNAYDLVILDAAAVFPTNRRMLDPVMLTKMVEGVVMLVLNEVTSKQMVKKAYKIMEIAGANVIGVVTNHQAKRH